MAAVKKGRYDVVVVGGGLIGAALPLAGSGLKIAVIEANRAGAPPPPERVIALSFGSSRILRQLGVWARLESHAQPILAVDVREPEGGEGVQLDHLRTGTEALGYVVENHRLLQILHEAVGEHADFLCPAHIEGIGYGDGGVVAVVKGEAGRREIHASLLVGADGGYSQVRRFAAIDCLGWDHNQFGLVASVAPARAHRGVAYECLRESGPLALLPLDDARCSIVWTLRPTEAQEHLELDDAAFMASLSAAMGPKLRERLGAIVATGPRVCHPFELRQAARYTGARVVLIGNAAHTIHPIAGQGLNLGMRDVRVLADVLRGAQAGGRDIGGAITLAEYSDRRIVDNASVVAFTEGLNFVFRQTAAPVRLARAAGLACMRRVPAAQDWLTRRAAGLSQIAGLLEEAE